MSWRALVKPFEPMPLFSKSSYVALPADESPTMASPGFMSWPVITLSRRITATAQLSTTTAPVRSPTSAVSPPPEYIFTPSARSFSKNASAPDISSAKAAPPKFFALRFTVFESNMRSAAPIQRRSSKFITIESCDIPRNTEASPVSL